MKPSTPVWVLAAALAGTTLTGTAVAATGGNFILGHANTAGQSTSLTNRGSGPALSLQVARGSTPPLSVGTNHARIPNLNADLLDGLHASSLQTKIVVRTAPMSSGVGEASCPSGTEVVSGGVEPDFGDSTTGFSDPLLWVNGPGFDSATGLYSWIGGAEDGGGSTTAYNGLGTVFAYCATQSAVTNPAASATAPSAAFKSNAASRYRASLARR